MHAEFAGAGAKQISADADVIAEVEQFVKLESLFADGIFLYVYLQPLIRPAADARTQPCP